MSGQPSGVLTETDRKFLRSDGDFYDGENARQSRYQRRRDIRGRIVQSVLDFQDVRTYLDESERRKIFADPANNGASDDLEFRAAIQSLLYWIYLGYREAGVDFTAKVTTPIARAEKDYRRQQSGDVVDVDVNFDIDVTDRLGNVDEHARRLEEGEPIQASNIYRIPTLPEFDADASKIDTIQVIPRHGDKNLEAERRILTTILDEHLGVEPTIEFIGHPQAEVELTDDDFGETDPDELKREHNLRDE